MTDRRLDILFGTIKGLAIALLMLCVIVGAFSISTFLISVAVGVCRG